jgi:hypothetical protein
MDISQLPAILAAVTALLVAFGTGIKWMLSRMDRRDKADRDWQENERLKLENLFSSRIATMEGQVNQQTKEIENMRVELMNYVRHVGVLEGLLKANGIEPPKFSKVGF